MDVRQHPRHVPERSKKLLDLPTQPGLLHCLRHLGIGWAKAPIWTWVGLLSILICHHHRCLCANPLLAMATMASQVQGQVYQYPNHHKRSWVYPPSHRHQLLLVVRGWVYLPILDQTEELFMVVEVQLCYKCCTGLRYVSRSILSREFGLTCKLQTGTVLCYIFIFFTLQYPKGGISLKWWGNEVWMNSERPFVRVCDLLGILTSPPAADYNRTPLINGPVP